MCGTDFCPRRMAVVTTHDLPTLRGWWEEGDLTLREQLDLYPSADFKARAHGMTENYICLFQSSPVNWDSKLRQSGLPVPGLSRTA